MSDQDTWAQFYKDRSSPAEPTAATQEEPDNFDAVPGFDPAEYKAFIVQRGRSRPAMFIDLRSIDARSGVLQGAMLSYPQLVAVDYVDDHTILLDFGVRQVRIEGAGLSELIQRLHSGSVSVVQVYSAKIWGDKEPQGPIVRLITHLSLGQGHSTLQA